MGKKIDFQKNKNKNGAESNYKHKTLKPRKAKKKYIYFSRHVFHACLLKYVNENIG